MISGSCTALPRLSGNKRAIARAGVGTDNIDKEAATRLGIVVMNTPTGNTLSTAEHAFTLMLALSRRVAEAYAPACFVVNENHDILHFSGRTGRYLQPSPGAASLNLFSIVDPSLRPDLRADAAVRRQIVRREQADPQRVGRAQVADPFRSR